MRKILLLFFIVSIGISLSFAQNYNGWSINENLKYKLDARMTIDGSCFYNRYSSQLKYDKELIKIPNGFSITNARLGISADIYKDWHAEIDVSFSDKGLVSLKDVYLKYKINDKNSVSFGNMKDAIMLSNIISSRYISIERPIPVEYINEGRHISLAWEYNNENNYLNLNFTFAKILNHQKLSNFKNEDFGLGFRYAYRKVLERNVLHLGFYDLTRFYGYDDNSINYNAYSSNGLHRLDINEIFMQGVRCASMGGVELLFNTNKMRLQGELIGKYINFRNDNKNKLLYGGYLNFSYSLIGNNSMTYDYNKASLKNDGNKSLEVFSQISYLNLDSISKYNKCYVFDSSLGFTWYPNKFILCSLFYDYALYKNSINDKYSWSGNLLPIHSLNGRIGVYF